MKETARMWLVLSFKSETRLKQDWIFFWKDETRLAFFSNLRKMSWGFFIVFIRIKKMENSIAIQDKNKTFVLENKNKNHAFLQGRSKPLVRPFSSKRFSGSYAVPFAVGAPYDVYLLFLSGLAPIDFTSLFWAAASKAQLWWSPISSLWKTFCP